jgi:hypothetical protein
LLALGCSVSSAAIHNERFFVRDSCCPNSQIKSIFGPPAALKNVAIINPSKYIKSSRFCVDVSLAALPKDIRIMDSRIGSLGRGQIAQFVCGSAFQSEVGFPWLGHWQTLTGIGDAPSGRLAVIFHDYLNDCVISRVHFRHDHIVDMDVSPQLPLGGLFSVPQRGIASLPKPTIGPLQSESEQGDHHRSKSDDVVVGGIAPNEFKQSEDRFMHGGARLIAGLIVAGLFLAHN